ncbi:MAG TPA: family 10 glycosylhydrolase [Segeticoccus sp.]|nr:family 10 glycosylhydrolase [Segeticoccus sp.]
MAPLKRRDFLASAAGVATLATLSGIAAPGALAAAHPDDCAVDPNAPKHQLRGMWIATVVNIDWPSRPGLPAAEQQAELIDLYDTAVARGYNTVVLQVRPTADAFWPSRIEPWSKYLTGTQGEDPGYDPLGFAIEQAHARNLKVHGWFNPHRVSMDTDLDALVPTHPARQHPEWVVAYGPKLYYDPGVPDVRRHNIAAIMDAVTRYDLDGVHFDDYFYPYPVGDEDFPDEDTFARYGAGFDDKDEWRRDNINTLILELAEAIHDAKPDVQFGVSPFAVWRNVATDPRGSATTAGAECYDDLYADTRRWVREEWLDYIAPQVYWAEGFAPADYDVLVEWWARQLRESGSHTRLFIGQAVYKIGTSTQSPEWIQDPQEMSNHLTFNLQYPEVAGDIFYNASSVVADRLGAMSRVTEQHYQHPALVPTMPWLDRHPPTPVAQLQARTGALGVRLSWRGTGRPATTYAVYRFTGRPRACDLADASHLVALVPAVPGDQRVHWVDSSTSGGTYAVTAVDRLGNESRWQVVAG